MRSNSNKEYRWTYFVELFSKRQLILAGRAVIGRRLSADQTILKSNRKTRSRQGQLLLRVRNRME
jgi:hypothetical protein